MKRISVFLLVIIGLVFPTVSRALDFPGGNGTSENPYWITTAEELNKVREYVNQENVYFQLKENIDLTDWLITNKPDKGWIPIGGDNLRPFKGHFDGNNCSISGLWIKDPTLRNAGIFAVTSDNSSLTDIHVEIVPPGIIAKAEVAGLVGSNNGEIRNCTVSIGTGAVIKGEEEGVAGLVSTNYSTGIITGCSVEGRIELYNDDIFASGLTVGGLVGLNMGSITDCSVSGEINATAENATVGGLVGDNGNYSQDPSITVCTVNVDIIATGNSNQIGGLSGFNSGQISNCSANGKVTTEEGEYVSVGGLVGHSQSSINTSFSNSEVTSKGDYNVVGGLIGSIIGDDENVTNVTVTNCYAGGAVTSTGDESSVGGLVGNTLDAEISCCYAYGLVTSGGNNDKVGGLIGSVDGNVTNSFASSEVKSTGSKSFVGGLAGSFSSYEDSYQISYSYATGSVTAEGDESLVGGFVGYCENTINTCYSIGVLKGSGNDALVGGLIGAVSTNREKITSSFFLQDWITNKGLLGVAGTYSDYWGPEPYNVQIYPYMPFSKSVLPSKGTDLKKEETFTNVTSPWKFLDNKDQYNENDAAAVWLINADDTSPYLWWQEGNEPRPVEDRQQENYNVVLSTGTGYTIIKTNNTDFESTVQSVKESTVFKFKIKSVQGYDLSGVKVFIDPFNSEITPVNGVYSITVNSDISIRVEGVTLKSHNITFQTGTGYTFVKENGDDFIEADLSVPHSTEFKFSIKLDPGYNQTNAKVYTTLSVDPIEPVDGVYTVTVTNDITISAEGIARNPSSNNAYHNMTLQVASGIQLEHYKPGKHLVDAGDLMYLSFRPDDPEANAENVILLVDGVETPFKEMGDIFYFGVLADADHTIEIAMRTYTVTLPETRGATTDHGPGNHRVTYGDSFCFCLTPEPGNTCAGARVFANGQELLHDGLRSESLYYTIDKVASDILVTIEGLNATGNLNIQDALIKITAGEGRMTVDNEAGKTLILAIYTLNGKLYAKHSLPPGTTNVSLPQGIYIVHAGDAIEKVSIR